MRIKIKTRERNVEVILDVIRVEKYDHHGEKALFIKEENMLFDLGEKFEEIFDSLLKNGYADLTEYSYNVLNGMWSEYAKI